MSDKKRTWSEKKRGVKSKINNVGEMIRSLRLSKGMTQRELALAIGSYTASWGGHIYKYEKRQRLPCAKYIYLLSEVFDIDKEVFFRIVLKEHYDNFITMHHKLFFKVVGNEAPRSKTIYNYINAESRYYFCREGKLKYNFHKFSGIMIDAYNKRNIFCRKIADEIILQKGENHRYSAQHIHNIINGKRVPSLKVVIDLCEFFGLKTFETYKIMVEEKGLAHAKNMMLQWSLYKERMEK